MAQIALEKLPYLTHVPKDIRHVPIMPYLDPSHKWSIFFERTPGLCDVFHPIEVSSSAFVTACPIVGTTDLYLPLSDLVFQLTSFSDTYRAVTAIEKDFLNGLASIHKYFVLLDYALTNKCVTAHTLVNTELEFAFGNHRSFYDLLVKLFTTIYEKLILTKGGKRVKPANLPDSFDKLLGKSDDFLANNFYFSPSIVEYVRSRETTFKALRAIRHNIHHRGHSPDSIFTTEKGFALRPDDKAWNELTPLGIWPHELLHPNRLASVLALLIFLVDDMHSAMAGLTDAITGLFMSLFGGIPQPISVGHRLYLRDILISYLYQLNDYRQVHWLDPKPVLEWAHREWEAVRQTKR